MIPDTPIDQVSDLDKWRAEAADLEKQSEDSQLWEEPDKAKSVTQRLTAVKQQISQVQQLTDQLEDGQTLLELLGIEVIRSGIIRLPMSSCSTSL